MAVFINPVGTLIPNPGRFGLDPGARIVFGTPDDDVFIFTGAFDGPDTIVVGMEGIDRYMGGINDDENRFYGSYLSSSFWDGPKFFLGNGGPWNPTSERDEWHGGEGDWFRGGNGGDFGVLHGGHYREPAQIMIDHPRDVLLMAGHERVVGFRFHDETVRREGDHFTARLSRIDLLGIDRDNPVTDGQRAMLRFDDPDHGPGWRPTMIDFEDRDGPTRREVQVWINEGDLVI